MAAYQSGLVLNAVLDQIFEDIAEPTTRLNGTIALIGVALLISAFLQAWLHFAGWAHMACRVLMTGNVDDYAILDWIVKKGLYVLKSLLPMCLGYVLIRTAQALVRAHAEIRRRRAGTQ